MSEHGLGWTGEESNLSRGENPGYCSRANAVPIRVKYRHPPQSYRLWGGLAHPGTAGLRAIVLGLHLWKSHPAATAAMPFSVIR
jgi:hypothetical protein